jgi:ligand-binding SRPBCC domain-containing protein
VKTYGFEAEQWLPRPRDEVFSFFSDAFNLERLTPSTLRFRVLTPPPIEMRAGTLIDYRLRIRGIPVRWQSEITVWEPPYRFVDEQRRGPYRLWCHEHRFEERDGGTLCRDFIRYAAPGGPLVNRLLVAPDVRRIFDYRRAELARVLGAGIAAADRSSPDGPPVAP